MLLAGVFEDRLADATVTDELGEMGVLLAVVFEAVANVDLWFDFISKRIV